MKYVFIKGEFNLLILGKINVIFFYVYVIFVFMFALNSWVCG